MEKEIFAKIKEYDTITIFGHVLPDGDCYGSQVGLKEAIRATFPHKKVYALGTGFPRMFSYLCPMDNVDEEVIKSSLAIVLDVANKERIEDQRYALAKEIIKIDHHVFVEKYGNLELVDTDTIATAQIIARLVKINEMKLTKLGAESLMLGIITDSGRFQYGETNAETFASAEYLMKQGVDLQALYQVLYASELSDLKYKGFIMSEVKNVEHVLYYVTTFADSKRLNTDPETLAGCVNLLSNINGFPVWASFAERESGQIRCELRSQEPKYNVQLVAAKHGGGGHVQAAGCRVSSLEEVKEVVDDLVKLSKGEF